MRGFIVSGIAVLVGCSNKTVDASGTGSAGAVAWWAGSSAVHVPSAGSSAVPAKSEGSGAAGSGSAAAPVAGRACLPTGGTHDFESFATDDKAVSLCTSERGDDDKKRTTCLALDFATGAWRGIAAAPPAPKPQPASGFEIKQDATAVSVCQGTACKKLAVRPLKNADGKWSPYLAAVSDDGKRAVLADDALKGAALFNARTGKKVRTIRVAAGGCWDTVGFLDEVVYVAVNVCAGPGAEGSFYSWKGKKIGKLDEVNPYGAPPIHLTGTRYAFGDLSGDAIAFVDSTTLKTQVLRVPDVPSAECEDCYAFTGSPVGGDLSLLKAPSGKLVNLASKSVVVVDPAGAKIEKQYPLPLCPKSR